MAELTIRLQTHEALLIDVRAVYESLESALAGWRPICLGGGGCCKFDLAGHRLLVTPAELAELTRIPPAGPPRPMRCPYQVAGRCTAYPRRPLGCRTYFCRTDAAAAARLADLHEAHHRRLRDLHDRAGIAYAYVELTAAVAELQTHP